MPSSSFFFFLLWVSFCSDPTQIRSISYWFIKRLGGKGMFSFMCLRWSIDLCKLIEEVTKITFCGEFVLIWWKCRSVFKLLDNFSRWFLLQIFSKSLGWFEIFFDEHSYRNYEDNGSVNETNESPENSLFLAHSKPLACCLSNPWVFPSTLKIFLVWNLTPVCW